MAQPNPSTTWTLPSNLEARHQRWRIRMIQLSVGVSVALMGLKFVTYQLTHSSAILSDALESIINVVASAFAMISVWMAAKPPDPEHPYGHGKIEYFSAGFEGALIVCAAIGIFYTGIERLITPRELLHLQEGLALLCAAILINLLLGIGLLRVGHLTESVTLVADGKHILTDVYTSGGVLVGLALVYWTGWLWLDGLVACLVGVNILMTGTRLVRQSFARLMDASDPHLLERIADLLEQHRRKEWIDIHQLRAWRAGNLVHIDLHLVLPGDMAVDKAHREAKRVETLLIDEFKGKASVLVHMDPCDPRLCPICNHNKCQDRFRKFRSTIQWEQDHLTRSLGDDPVRPSNDAQNEPPSGGADPDLNGRHSSP